MATQIARWLVLVVISLAAYQPLSAQAEPPGATAPGAVVDFQDADLRLVISALAEAGNLNVVYSDLPPRRVTLRLTEPVPREHILPLLRSLVESNGLRLVESGSLVRIESGGARPAAGRVDDAAVASDAELRLFVHRLQHAQAPRLAGTLQNLFGGQGRAPAAGLSRSPLSEALREHRIPAPNASDESGLEVAAPLPGIRAVLQNEVQIVPDELTNSLLVRSTASDWEVIRRAIDALDLRPLQVIIEAHIVEVRRSDELDVSVGIDGSVGGEVGEPAVVGGIEAQEMGGLGLEILGVPGLNIDATLSALASRGEVRILSRPVITAQNNQEARILVGAERPFIQVFRTLPTESGVRDQIIQYRDVGTSLTVKPTINADGYVNLQVTQEVSTATSEQQFGAPVISTREASTLLYVRDGQTAVIGGLIDRQQERVRSGIPFLMDIPILGALFRTTRRVDLNSELFLFLTPHVITSDIDMERVRRGVSDGTPGIREPLPHLPIVPRTGGSPIDVPLVSDTVVSSEHDNP